MMGNRRRGIVVKLSDCNKRRKVQLDTTTFVDLDTTSFDDDDIPFRPLTKEEKEDLHPYVQYKNNKSDLALTMTKPSILNNNTADVLKQLPICSKILIKISDILYDSDENNSDDDECDTRTVIIDEDRRKLLICIG